MSEDLTRRGDAVYERLFGSPPDTDGGSDPEFMAILRRVIFGDVFNVGQLDDRTRELITVTVLATLQCHPQLTSHTQGALGAGATAVEIREAIYQLAPFIGFPRTLNAIAAMNQGLQQAGVELPLPPQATVAVDDRFEAGSQIQQRLYGDEIREELADGTELGDAVPRLLTEFCFGDFETRDGLSVPDRELFLLCALATLGLGPQITAHIRGCRTAGISGDTIGAALVHCIPYAGFPNAVNAFRLLRSAG